MARHVTKEEKVTIRRLREEEELTYREIGIEIGCSAITAGRVCNPAVIEGRREYRRKPYKQNSQRKIPPPHFTRKWCEEQQSLKTSINQMAKVFDVSPRVMRRWQRDLGLPTNEPVNPRLVKRRRAFCKAMDYANALEIYPRGEEIDEMATQISPFHANDLMEMIATRQYRGLGPLRRKM